MENRPVQAIERMNEFDLLQVISPEIKYTEAMKNIFEDIKEVISWFNLLYLEEPYEAWKIYWYGLTFSLEGKALKELAKRMSMNDLESRKMITQRLGINSLIEDLFRLKTDDNYGIYTLLAQYDTEILLYMMARVNNDKIKKLISNYFTKLKRTEVKMKGRDLKELGFKPGPLYKEIFNRVLKAKLNDLVSTKKDEIDLVKEEYGGLLDGKAAVSEKR